MYSPKIPEQLIPILYRLGRERGRPMRHLVAEAVERYLEDEGRLREAAAEARSNLVAHLSGPERLSTNRQPLDVPGRRRSTGVGVGIGNAPGAAQVGIDHAAANASLGAGNVPTVTVTPGVGLTNAPDAAQVGIEHATSGTANVGTHRP